MSELSGGQESGEQKEEQDCPIRRLPKGIAAAIWAALLLAGAVFYHENRAMKAALSQADRGYLAFMSTPVKGKMLADLVDSRSVGAFRQGEDVILCGRIRADKTSEVTAP